MKDVVFVQFKEDRRVTKDGLHYITATCLNNGFSNTYELCKNVGDVVWVDKKEYQFPIKRGIMYVSAFFHQELIEAIMWAKHNPNLSVTIGGPATQVRGYEFGEPVPPNVEITTKTVEKRIFNCPPSFEWKLEFPPSDHPGYVFSYPVSRRCYWNKCSFCSYAKVKDIFHRGTDKLIIDGQSNKNLGIWLAAPTLSPRFLKYELAKLPRIRGTYFGFLRADRGMVINLEDGLRSMYKNSSGKLPLRFCIGVECPSDRMLKIMDKGVVISDIITVATLLTQYKCEFIFSLIENWNNLEVADVPIIEEFCKRIFEVVGRKLPVRLHLLTVGHDQAWREDIKREVVFRRDQFKYMCYVQETKDKQRELNEAIRRVYETYFHVIEIPIGG